MQCLSSGVESYGNSIVFFGWVSRKVWFGRMIIFSIRSWNVLWKVDSCFASLSSSELSEGSDDYDSESSMHASKPVLRKPVLRKPVSTLFTGRPLGC